MVDISSIAPNYLDKYSGDNEKYLQKKYNKEKCKKPILIKLGVLIKMALFLDTQIIIEEELINLF